MSNELLDEFKKAFRAVGYTLLCSLILTIVISVAYAIVAIIRGTFMDELFKITFMLCLSAGFAHGIYQSRVIRIYRDENRKWKISIRSPKI